MVGLQRPCRYQCNKHRLTFKITFHCSLWTHKHNNYFVSYCTANIPFAVDNKDNNSSFDNAYHWLRTGVWALLCVMTLPVCTECCPCHGYVTQKWYYGDPNMLLSLPGDTGLSGWYLMPPTSGTCKLGGDTLGSLPGGIGHMVGGTWLNIIWKLDTLQWI